MAKVLLISKATASYFARFAKQITAGMKQRGYSAEIDPQTETKEGFLNAIEETLQEIKAENPKYNTAEALKRFNSFKDKPYFSIVWGNPGGLYYIANKGEFYENPYLQEIDPDTQAEAFQFIAFTGVNEILSEETAETVRKLLGLEDYSYIPMTFRLAIQVVAGISQYAENEKTISAESVIEVIESISKFSPIAQNNVTNTIAETPYKKSRLNSNDALSYALDIFNTTETIKTRKGVEIQLRQGNKALTTQGKQTLDFIISQYTKTGFKKRDIFIPLEEYIRIRQFSDSKENKKDLVKRMNSLLNDIRFMQVTWKGSGKGFISLFEKGYINAKGGFYIELTPTFYDFIKTHKDIYYLSDELQRINVHNFPHAYPIGRKLEVHAQMNAGKPNENIISVQSLLDVTEIPTKETVKDTNRHYRERIIDPFEKSMEELERQLGAGFKWEYCEQGKAPVKDVSKIYDIDTFLTLYIFFEIDNIPKQKERIQHHKERKLLAEGKRAKEVITANKDIKKAADLLKK